MHTSFKLALIACALSLLDVVHAEPVLGGPPECPTFSCAGCGPGSYPTLSTIGTACPFCACAPTTPVTPVPAPTPPIITTHPNPTSPKPPLECPTFSCPGCPTGSYITLSTIGTACPFCACAPYATTKSSTPDLTPFPPIITTDPNL